MSADKRAEPRAAEAKLTAYLQVLVPAEYGQFPSSGIVSKTGSGFRS